jgi:hypothetical protein
MLRHGFAKGLFLDDVSTVASENLHHGLEPESPQSPWTPGAGSDYSLDSSGLESRYLGQSWSLSDQLRSRERSGNATLIFDWDDTLFPTWYVTEVVLACRPEESLTKGGPLPEDSPFAQELAHHAKAVESVLREAAKHGQVAIVTLGMKTWVDMSASRWLPTLNFEALRQELGISVVYARDCLKRHTRSGDEDVNIFAVAKALAMKKVVKRLIRDDLFGGNLISIGDSHFEAYAAKDFLWSICGEHRHLDPVVKTVKLLHEPNLEELRMQLVFLQDWLHHFVCQAADFDLCLMENEDGILERLTGYEL